MNLQLSNKYEECVALGRQSMLSYFQENGLSWNFEERLRVYRTCELYEVTDGVTVGYVALREKDEKLYLADLQILAEFQNKGYGTKLLASVKNIAKIKGYDLVYLKVFKNNPALNLYLRNGYGHVTEEQYVYLLSAKT